ncbi:tape measure protein [Stutzerimonas nitrititolerans]|uniref:tape measure protein n=1 Tax=Stutzerimonas nitrititolerans TaxID=2482751 RepID=UPI00289849FA|nr:tape measure protein [Stutzerimonas nitrititolerans]
MAKRDVELIIRAKNEATSTVDAVAKSMAELEERQNTLGTSAKKTDGLLGQLADEFDKLKAVGGSVQALDRLQEAAARAGDAFVRQATELAKSRENYTDLTRSQQMVATAGQKLQAEVEQSAAALAKEAKAASETKARLNEYAAAQRKAAREAAAAEAALAKARAKYAEKPTAIRETKLVDASLRVQQTKKAAREAALAEAQLTKAYAAQSAQLQINRTAHSTAAQSLSELESAEKKLASEITKTESAIARQSDEMVQAQSEYAELTQVMSRAEQTFQQTAAAQGVLGQSSQQVATQLTILKARMQELQAASKGAGNQSRPMIDPAALRESNLGLREAMTTIRAAANEASRGEVSLRELGNAVDQVSRSGKQLDGLLRAVEKQDAAVSSARQEWASAQAEVKRLAGAIRSATQPSEQLAAAFGRAQGRARAAKDAFLQESAAADELSTGLRQAGLQHSTLADAQARLKTSIAANSAALTRGRATLIGYSGGADRAASGSRKAAGGISSIKPAADGSASGLKKLVGALAEVNSGGRTTLSLTQRLRGQLLSMAAAAGGLYGVRDALGGVVQAQLEMDAVQSRLSVAFEGDQQKVQRALAFTEKTADELGLSFRTLSLQYSKLAAASLGTNLEGEKTEAIFRSMAEAARVLRLTDDEVAGSFKAMTDIMSKGTIQAEELKGQLGDRFPGAVQIMAKALGIGTAELAEMMEQGQLTSDKLYEFSQEMGKRVAPALADAVVSASAKIARLQNAVFETQLAIAKSGFLDELSEGVEHLTEALNDPAVQEGFKKLGHYLGELIELGIVLVDNIDAVVMLLGAMLGIKVAGSLAASFISISKAAKGLYGTLGSVEKGLVALKAASAAAGGGLSGMLTVLGRGAAYGGLYGLIAAEIYLIADAAYDAYQANQKLEALKNRQAQQQVKADRQQADALVELNKLRAAAGKDQLRIDQAVIRSTEELIGMTDKEIDAYQDLLIARMKVVGATRTAEELKGKEKNLQLIAQLNSEERQLMAAVEQSAVLEQARAAAVTGTADAVGQVAAASEDAGAKADALKQRLDAVAQMNFDNSIIALERVHNAKMAALTLSGADEQQLLSATTQFESQRLDIVRQFSSKQLELVRQDTERRKQILDTKKLDDAARAEELKKIEDDASKARIQIVQQEVQAVSSAREQALGRYMSALQRVADLDRRIADIRLQGEFQVADIRRGAMADHLAYQSRQQELTKLNGRIQEEIARGNFEVAEALAQRQMSLAQSLNQEVKNGEKIVVTKEQAARNAVAGTQKANENLISVLQKRKEIEKAEAEEQKRLYENLTSTLEKLNKTLARVSGAEEIDIPLTVDEAKAKSDLDRTIAQMKGKAFESRVGVPISADTREYVAKFDSDVLSKDGSQVRVGVFMEDGAYKIKVNEIQNQKIVATAQVEFSGSDLQAAVARARQIVEGDFPKMQLAFDSAKTYAEFQQLSEDVRRKLSEQSFVVSTQFQAEDAEVQALRQELATTVTQAPVDFKPDTREVDIARLKAGEMIIVPVKFVPTGDVTRRANGGVIKVPGFASGGSPGGLIRGPGTGTSDSILAAVSNREYIVRAMAVRKYGTGFLDQLNAGTLNPDRLAGAMGGGRGGAAEGGDSMSVNLTINGRETGRLSGSRSSVQNLVDSLHEIARQTGG